MLGADGCTWLGEVDMRIRNGTQLFGNLRTHYDGPGEHLKRVTEENYILENIHYKNKNIAVTFEVYVTRIKELYQILKDHDEVHNDSQKVQKLNRGIRSDAPAYSHTEVVIVKMDTDLKNYFNLALDMLSQYISTRSPNVDFVRKTRVRGGRNVSSVTGGGRGGDRGAGRFVYGQGR